MNDDARTSHARAFLLGLAIGDAVGTTVEFQSRGSFAPVSPIPGLEKYHDHIVSLHLKVRTADGGNVPWGEGQSPIKEVLQLMRKEKSTFPVEIELEYKIPEGSNAIAEVAKCVQYYKQALA